MSWMPTASELGWDQEFYRGFIVGMNLWVFLFAVVLLITVLVVAFTHWRNEWILLIAFSIVFVVYSSVVGLDALGYFSYAGDWSTWPTAEELGITGNFGSGLLLGFALFDLCFSLSYTLIVALAPKSRQLKAVLIPVLLIWVGLDLWLILEGSGVLDAVLLPLIRYWSR